VAPCRAFSSSSLADFRPGLRDLLEGIGVRDPSFEEWLLIERQRLRNCAIAVLTRLTELRTGLDGIAAAERLIALDPLQEEGYRALMRLHAQAGELGLALRCYESCRDFLRQELNVAPSAETEALHRDIRGGQHQRAPADREKWSPPSALAQEHAAERGPPGKPSIAVLPFENLSGDPEQRYFSDGTTGDLIVELSRFRSLTVIARNSSFLYRDKSVDVRQIGRELGVDFILEGSVRRAGDRIRISAELAEAATGKHVWAERYDRELGDLFKVQDEVTQAIVTTLPSRIDEAGARVARRKRPENLSAFECYLRGLAYVLEFEFIEHHPAREMLERAVSLDPNLAPAYAILAVMELRHWWAYRSSESLAEAFALAQKSVQLDQNEATCQCSLGMVCLERRQLEDAEFHIRRALALNPNDPRAAIHLAGLLAYCGQPDEGLAWVERVFRLDPFGPQWYHSSAGMVFFCAGLSAIHSLVRTDHPPLVLLGLPIFLRELRVFRPAGRVASGHRSLQFLAADPAAVRACPGALQERSGSRPSLGGAPKGRAAELNGRTRSALRQRRSHHTNARAATSGRSPDRAQISASSLGSGCPPAATPSSSAWMPPVMRSAAIPARRAPAMSVRSESPTAITREGSTPSCGRMRR
jgi:TolB-like protein